MRCFALLLTLALAGCATSSAFRAGEKAERRQNYDQAVLEYSKALKENPDNPHYRKSLERARLRASEEHARAGRRLLGRGLHKEALDEFKLALDLNPDSATLGQDIENAERHQRGVGPGASVQALKDRVRERSLPGLEIEPSLDLPISFKFEGAEVQEAYKTLGLDDRTLRLEFTRDAVPQLQKLVGYQPVGRSWEPKQLPFVSHRLALMAIPVMFLVSSLETKLFVGEKAPAKAENGRAVVSVGRNQKLFFTETKEEPPAYDGHPMQIYIAEFASGFKPKFYGVVNVLNCFHLRPAMS